MYYSMGLSIHLKEVDSNIDQTAPVRTPTLGQEVWRHAEKRPVPRSPDLTCIWMVT